MHKRFIGIVPRQHPRIFIPLATEMLASVTLSGKGTIRTE